MGRGLSKLVISRVIIRDTPFRLLSPLPIQVETLHVGGGVADTMSLYSSFSKQKLGESAASGKIHSIGREDWSILRNTANLHPNPAATTGPIGNSGS